MSENNKYPGSGTSDDPYIVDWDKNDPENPRNWTTRRKWTLNFQLAFGTFVVSFASSSYSGGLEYTVQALHTSRTLAVLGISLYVLGFGVGPLFFAPLSEMYGRRIVYLYTYTPYWCFHIGGALAPNIQTLVVTRFLAGIAGSAPLSNAGGQIGDMFDPKDRGLATALYAMCVFFGPILGPIVGGFVSQYVQNGWRVVFWILFAVAGIVVLMAWLGLSETYAPVLLRWRARKLHKASGKTVYYTTVYDLNSKLTKREILAINLKRPFIFLLKEPIVTLLSIYIAVAYATLYAMFTAFPIVFQEHRGFTPSQGGLAFLGIGLGQAIGIGCTPIQKSVYARAVKRGGGSAPPEARLYLTMLGGVLLPIGLFWFAWTTILSIPWIVPIIAGIPFGAGMFFIFNSITSYLMDTYGIFCASALASTILLRSTLAAAFPLFSPTMFDALGDQWAMSVFAFLALALLPVPILFFRYGAWIRRKSKFAIHGDVGYAEKSGSEEEVQDPEIAQGEAEEDRTDEKRTVDI